MTHQSDFGGASSLTSAGLPLEKFPFTKMNVLSIQHISPETRINVSLSLKAYDSKMEKRRVEYLTHTCSETLVPEHSGLTNENRGVL